ncbi:Helix-turn-helix [Arachidicoccus rhizosphaerae]|jgi:hypothetical protein|uniref:Helix-turn-helix n=1 Tax=Arachidicoccus rhizosphaerae TaxID=551991 RepID=A0A1H3VKC8_9BACT|nr:helix-turn-helix transcriptional regulator [Arachidicoccus rhizosphaerae]SDZ74608.1 Helix-turn-helix [Arachidicoccus rhizosphaerae]
MKADETNIPNKKTVGQVLAELRNTRFPNTHSLAKALMMSHTTYLSIERDQRELSFLAALRLCRFYDLDIHELISRIGEDELERPDRSVLRQWEKMERRKNEQE